ncbi:hypothetical protein SGLAM104S_05822 [Streptomyces glaucescens]
MVTTRAQARPGCVRDVVRVVLVRRGGRARGKTRRTTVRARRLGRRPRGLAVRTMDETVGQGRAQLPSRPPRRRAGIGGGHDPHPGRQSQRPDPPFQDHPQERGLDGRGGGGQLVQEEQSAPGAHQFHGPLRRRHRHSAHFRVVADDGQPGEVGRLVDAGDHGGQRQVEGGGKLGEGRGLADARLAPEQYGQVGGDGEGERFELFVGARLGGGRPQQAEEVVGEGELVAGRGGGGGYGRGQQGAGGHGHHLGCEKGTGQSGTGCPGGRQGVRRRTTARGGGVRGVSGAGRCGPAPCGALGAHRGRHSAVQPGPVARLGVLPALRGPAFGGAGSGVHGDQSGAEEPVVDAACRGRLQFVPERSVAQHRGGAEQALDHGQRPGDVTVAEPFPDGGQGLGLAVHPVDGPQAGQCGAAEGHEHFLPAQLGRFVVDGRQHPVPQGDPVDLAPARHPVRVAGPGRRRGLGRGAGRHRQGCGDERVQPPCRDQPGPQQFQIRQDADGRLRQHRERRGLLRRQRLPQRPQGRDMAVVGGGEFEHGAAAGAEPYGERPAGPPLGAQQQFRLGGPALHRPGGLGRAGPAEVRERSGRRRTRCLPRAAAPCQFAAACGVPEVPVQVEPGNAGRDAGAGGAVGCGSRTPPTG